MDWKNDGTASCLLGLVCVFIGVLIGNATMLFWDANSNLQDLSSSLSLKVDKSDFNALLAGLNDLRLVDLQGVQCLQVFSQCQKIQDGNIQSGVSELWACPVRGK
jgi:hypothetical protein